MKLFAYSFGYGGMDYRLTVVAATREAADALVVADLSHLSNAREAYDGAYDREVTEYDLTRPGVVLSASWDGMA